MCGRNAAAKELDNFVWRRFLSILKLATKDNVTTCDTKIHYGQEADDDAAVE